MPYATTHLIGNEFAPKLDGKIDFFPWLDGTLVKVEIANLPSVNKTTNNQENTGFFAFHIHEGSTCDDSEDHFKMAKGHYNPTKKEHPFHAGDLPSLLSNNGYSFMTFYTSRFKPEDIIKKAVIVHLKPDDYRTQPSGDAGERIACGIIVKN
ncbi:MAG: superoxide dismutase family protein [Bacilli bacterium]|nr:superoxide dismutase family protein [Bacilli bacterium]MDD4054124.1 superoxide dismutase family protein [Bacilli bacterium]MDD4411914.1 superoxide dismutase family protein [Bacilli bacterium]